MYRFQTVRSVEVAGQGSFSGIEHQDGTTNANLVLPTTPEVLISLSNVTRVWGYNNGQADFFSICTTGGSFGSAAMPR